MAFIFAYPPELVRHSKDALNFRINPSGGTTDFSRFRIKLQMIGEVSTSDIIHESTFYVFASYNDNLAAVTALFNLSERIDKLFFEDIAPYVNGQITPYDIIVAQITRDSNGRGTLRRYNILVQQFSGDPVAAVGSEQNLSVVAGYHPWVLYGGSNFSRTYAGASGNYMDAFAASSSLSWLTLAPNNKFTVIGKPEYLAFLYKNGLPDEWHRRVKLVFTDNTNVTYNLSDTPDIINNVHLFYFGADYTSLDIAANIPVGKTLWYYEVWLADAADDPLISARRFYIDRNPYQNVRTITFLTSLGTWETVHFPGLARNKSEYVQKTSNTSLIAFQSTIYGTRQVADLFYQESQRVSIQLDSREWLVYMKDLLLSKFKFELINGNWVPIENVTNNLVIDDDKPGFYFEYEYRYRFTEIAFQP